MVKLGYLVALLVITSVSKAELTENIVKLASGKTQIRCSLPEDSTTGDVSAIQLGCSVLAGSVCRAGCSQVCPNYAAGCIDYVTSCRKGKNEIIYEVSSTRDNSHQVEKQYWCRLASTNSFVAGFRKYFTTDVVFIIAICAVVSCLLNVIFCIRCQMTRNYLHRLALGGGTNRCKENCLCIQRLSGTYKPKDGEQRWSVTVNPSYKLPFSPLTDPTPRRPPLPMMSHFPSVHTAMPKQIAEEDVIYDDVHQSTIYTSDNKPAVTYEGYLPPAPGTPGSGRRCLVDKDGMVYVAMGHVSQTPQITRKDNFGSKGTVTSFQPDRPSPNVTPRQTTPVILSKNSPRLSSGTPNSSSPIKPIVTIPEYAVPFPIVTTSKATLSSVSPPIPFADQYDDDDDMADPFDMARDTILRSSAPHSGESSRRKFGNGV